MSELTMKPAGEQSNIPKSGDENNNSNSPFEQKHKPIKGTPFHYTTTAEGGVFLRMGDFQISPVMKDEEDIKEWLNENYWNTIVTLIGTALSRYEKNKHLFMDETEEYQKLREKFGDI